MARSDLQNPLVIFTRADTGRRIAISSMWLKTIEETAGGTVMTLADRAPITVEEQFMEVMSMFTLEAYADRAKFRR
jgi:hypothetical protein